MKFQSRWISNYKMKDRRVSVQQTTGWLLANTTPTMCDVYNIVVCARPIVSTLSSRLSPFTKLPGSYDALWTVSCKMRATVLLTALLFAADVRGNCNKFYVVFVQVIINLVPECFFSVVYTWCRTTDYCLWRFLNRSLFRTACDEQAVWHMIRP